MDKKADFSIKPYDKTKGEHAGKLKVTLMWEGKGLILGRAGNYEEAAELVEKFVTDITAALDEPLRKRVKEIGL